MSDFVTVGKTLVDWLLKKNARRNAQIDEYIKSVQNTCIELIEIKDPLSDKATLMHEQIKVIYELAAKRLPKKLMEQEGWNLYRGLSSARIYYWLRIYDMDSASNQIQSLLSDRNNLPSSLDSLLSMLSKNNGKPEEKMISTIREQCLRDIARILEIKPFF